MQPNQRLGLTKLDQVCYPRGQTTRESISMKVKKIYEQQREACVHTYHVRKRRFDWYRMNPIVCPNAYAYTNNDASKKANDGY